MAQTVQRENRERLPFLFGLMEQEKGTTPCLAETVQRESRERFLVLFWNGSQEQDLIKMYLLWNFFGQFHRKINTNCKEFTYKRLMMVFKSV